MGDYIKEQRKIVGHAPITIPHAVVVLFNKQGQVLLEERADDGYFDFPGGAVDPGEEVEDAAKRELLEETGLLANKLKLFKVYTGEITHYVYFNGDEIYGIDSVYLCKDYSGSLKPQKEEVKELKFHDLNNLPNKMSKRNKQIVDDLLNTCAYREI